MIHPGLCGFTMSAARYFETFRVLEVQQTFYEPPSPATLAKWRAQAPPDFEFTMKAWQLVTHRGTSRTYRRLKTQLSDAELRECGNFRSTDIVRRGYEKSVECARILKATAILFQCPASFRPEVENVASLRQFFGSVKRPEGVRFLWEPRGAWPDDVISGLCRELSLVHAVDPFVRPSLTPSLTYWRLHGITGSRHVYTDAELRQLVQWLPDEARECYVMFNNMPRIEDARRFARLIS